MKKHRKKLIAAVIIILVLIVAVPVGIIIGGKIFTAQEKVVRTDWTMEVGETVDKNEDGAAAGAYGYRGRGFYLL